MAITLTEKAAKHVNRYLERRGKGIGLRFGVRTTGCSGLAYKLEYVDDATPDDNVFESHGVKVLGPVDHEGWSRSIYFQDPNGLALEVCFLLRKFDEEDARPQLRFRMDGRKKTNLDPRYQA